MNRITNKKLSVLIVDDEEGIRHGLTTFFRKKGFVAESAGDFSAAVQIVNHKNIDAAIVDIKLKGSRSGIDLIRTLKAVEPDMIVVVITGYGSIDTAVTSMKVGASDYILKPIDNQKLLDTVIKNLEIHHLKSENIYLRKEILDRYITYKFLTANPELEAILHKAKKIKDELVTVLITGETGTGKEVLARYIHYTSSRRDNKFITINCAALSEDLLLSELFGHERGAFTGAIERKIGKFELAHGGTLFLDEIGDMSLEIQAKLLRVIEENSFERVGGTKRIDVNVRLIAATNRNLRELISHGKFREDLFYRINVVSFHIPPLRERKEDIPLLTSHFIKKYNKRYNRKIIDLDDEAYKVLLSHSWPGNVRELENVINQIVLLSDSKIITMQELEKSNLFITHEKEPILDFNKVTSLKDTMTKIIEIYEKKIILHFLRINNFNKSKTAEALGITRKTLNAKIENYGISAPRRLI